MGIKIIEYDARFIWPLSTIAVEQIKGLVWYTLHYQTYDPKEGQPAMWWWYRGDPDEMDI